MSQTEKLIALVRQYPLLYDRSHQDYKNNRKKDRAWDVIGKALNEDGDQIKKKWRNIRDTYAKYLKSKMTKTGHSSKKNYTKWQWAPHMEPFREFFPFGDTVSNTEDENSNDTKYGHSLGTQVDEEEQNEEETPEDVLPQPQSGNTDSEHVLSNSNTTRQRRKAKEPVLEEKSSVNAVLEYLNNKRTAPSMDAIDIIFQGYAQSLKQFSPKRQANVKIKIATIMAEEEMLHQQEQEKILSSGCSH